MTRFRTLDIFADRRFCGASVAVVDAALSEPQRAAIAGEFNLHAAVFVAEPHDPINSARLHVVAAGLERISLARRRWPPPSIWRRAGPAGFWRGTASSWRWNRTGRCCVARCCAARHGACFAHFDWPIAPHRSAGDAPTAQEVARALALPVEDIGFHGHVPSVYSAGVPLLFVPLGSGAALDRAQRTPVFEAALGEAAGAYLYVLEPEAAACAIRARMLPKALNVAEEPASAVAAAAFAGVAHRFEQPDDGEHEIYIEQGHGLGRPSRITLRMSIENGALAGVGVGGRAATVTEGTLNL